MVYKHLTRKTGIMLSLDNYCLIYRFPSSSASHTPSPPLDPFNIVHMRPGENQAQMLGRRYFESECINEQNQTSIKNFLNYSCPDAIDDFLQAFNNAYKAESEERATKPAPNGLYHCYGKFSDKLYTLIPLLPRDLTTLNLNNFRFSDTNQSGLTPKLKWIGDRLMPCIANALPHLKVLNLRNCYMNEFVARSFHSCHWQSLEILDLRGSRLMKCPWGLNRGCVLLDNPRDVLREEPSQSEEGKNERQ